MSRLTVVIATIGVAMAVALGGCATGHRPPVRAIDSGVWHLTQRGVLGARAAGHALCPKVWGGNRRSLTRTEAHRCLRRPWTLWLGALRHAGYDPNKIANRR